MISEPMYDLKIIIIMITIITTVITIISTMIIIIIIIIIIICKPHSILYIVLRLFLD